MCHQLLISCILDESHDPEQHVQATKHRTTCEPPKLLFASGSLLSDGHVHDFQHHVQVIEQVEHVALAVKQGSEISDLRHHTFLAPSLKVISSSNTRTSALLKQAAEC